ncbi:MAG: glycoside hydrolase family 13 protein [Lactobacillales bacterium]|jgi:alpha-glucosidase|nr:glycoside hydrolase family 13 protein [Lactobacillales bacterium]
MPQIFYNSFSNDYKAPFGACKIGTDVDFNIFVRNENVEAVTLVIRYEDGPKGTEYCAMEKSHDSFYHFKYKLQEGIGLYFYYFIISYHDFAGGHTSFYGSVGGSGGIGQEYAHEGMTVPYQLTCYLKDEVAPDWYQNSVFYQIFPDRFAIGGDGRIKNPKRDTFIYASTEDEPLYIKTPGGDIARWDFYGGNFEGVIEKIPYLLDLGVNAIYFNPIVEARSNHRYDASDFQKIDPVLGGEEDFVKMVDALHSNGIRLILDGAFSNVGRNSIYFNFDGAYGENVGAYQNRDSQYYPWFTFIDYPWDYESWWGIKDLPAVNKHNLTYQEYIYGKTGSVLTKYNDLGIDGWRLDVADELPDEFIKGLRSNLDGYADKILLGEVWEDASNKIAYNQRRKYVLGDAMHGVMNYPFKEVMINLINGSLNASTAAHRLTVLQENLPRDVYYNNLNNIGTHDTERILSILGGDKQKLKLIFGLMFNLPGIPCVYYGDEAGVDGGKDPDNRKFFPWNNIDHEVRDVVKGWAHKRGERSELKTGDFSAFYYENVLGIVRSDDAGTSVYLLNPTFNEIKINMTHLTFMRHHKIWQSKLRNQLNDLVVKPMSDHFITL